MKQVSSNYHRKQRERKAVQRRKANKHLAELNQQRKRIQQAMERKA